MVPRLPDEKLVRDFIPRIIRDDGGSPSVRRALDEELDKLIRHKIVEEAVELLDSGDETEIADILEAINALLNHRGLGLDQIEDLREEKKRKRGGFREGYVLDMESI